MGVKWTEDQQKVIDLRNRNILVSAAAGSGKTAVLVERIVKMVTDSKHPIDIDRLLVVTFTNAAAAEMRERVSAAIEKALELQPEDEHLQKQLTLIHNAQITTIDSFCLYVVRNHFYEIDMEPNFRIADEGELKLLRQDVIKRVLEAHYEEPDAAFTALMEGYAPGKSDDAVVEMILELYHFSRSYPWPKQWLSEAKSCYEINSVDKLNHAPWIQAVVTNIRLALQDMVASLKLALQIALEPDGPYMYEKALQSDIAIYERLAKLESFSALLDEITSIKYERLASSKGYTGSEEKLEYVKIVREEAKETIKKLVKQYGFAKPDQMVEQLIKTKPAVTMLIQLVEEFTEAFAAEKKKKNLVDFYDVEHFALDILVDEETGKAKQTADEYRDAYVEIMIDEYQDSNYVQEAILTSISRMEWEANNIFMVGDVKQSIYRFRLARPELFMEKYDSYSFEAGPAQRIDLHQNFRSRNEVLEATNDVFFRIMGRDLGNVVYDEKAALRPGAAYTASEQMKAELLLVESDEGTADALEYEDKKVLEAKLVASRIKQLVKELKVTDKATGELRETKYSDIVILLRSLSGWAEAFTRQLNEEGIPAHAVSSTGYFGTIEVQTVLSMLRILDNPRQDIPLAAVLKSPIGDFTDEEMAVFRLYDKECAFHACILNLCEHLCTEGANTPAEEKLKAFYKKYQSLREKVADTPIHELIEVVLQETGYGRYVAAMPAGNRRKANIEMLIEKAIAYEKTSYKGLFHFVRYIDELQKYDVDFGEADLVGENENVVRIMSIHKSKGLEFPVVFVAGLGKSFNRQDSRSRMVLHPEYGIGLDAMDGTRRIKTPTIAKKVIAKQIDLENLGEELRVLYVALTRAKEKLILTGNCKQLEDKLKKYQAVAPERMVTESGLLPYRSREGAASYLDWLLPAMLSYGDKYPVYRVSIAQLVGEEIEKQVTSHKKMEERLDGVALAEDVLVKEIAEVFEAKYPYPTDVTRKNKYSVSELKHRAMRKAFEEEDEDMTPVFAREEEFTACIPRFLQVQAEHNDEGESGDRTSYNMLELYSGQASVNQGALRGTAVHRVMECYDFTSELPAKEQIQTMCKAGLLTAEARKLVRTSIIEDFLASETGKRMKAAALRGELYREKPFVMGLKESELAKVGLGEDTGQLEDDLTLVQGIIDVFWVEEDGIVLLDYKTDYVEREEELIMRYAAQMELYADALNRVFLESGKKVKEKLIYAFRFGTVISVE